MSILREKAILEAYSARGDLVEELEMSLEEYYEYQTELIDSSDYRISHGIVKIVGTLYDPSGRIEQRFENLYSQSGEYLSGKTEHCDGTVNKD